MIFYFNIRSDDVVDLDQEGLELQSLDAARREAEKAAREMVAEMVLQNEQIDGMRFDIVDASGLVLDTVRFRDVIRLQ